jgi:predicted ATPase
VLSRFSVRNFKSLRDVDLELAPLTLLYGPNSAGKSSVITALEWFRQGATSLQDSGESDADRRAVLDFISHDLPVLRTTGSSGDVAMCVEAQGWRWSWTVPRRATRSVVPGVDTGSDALLAELTSDRTRRSPTAREKKILSAGAAAICSDGSMPLDLLLRGVDSDGGEAITPLSIIDFVPLFLEEWKEDFFGGFGGFIRETNTHRSLASAGSLLRWNASDLGRFQRACEEASIPISGTTVRSIALAFVLVCELWFSRRAVLPKIPAPDDPMFVLMLNFQKETEEFEAEFGGAEPTVFDALVAATLIAARGGPVSDSAVSAAFKALDHSRNAKPSKSAKALSELMALLQKCLGSSCLHTFHNIISSSAWAFLGPQRHLAKWEERFAEVELRHPGLLGAAGEQVPQVLAKSEGALRRTNEWLKKLEIPYHWDHDAGRVVHEDMGRGRKKITERVFRPRLIDNRRSETSGRPVKVELREVGFGVSQVVPVVTQLNADLGDNALVCIQQPELHLHPRLQTALGDLFIQASSAQASVSQKQLIVETHSEHLMMRIQRRIAEGSVDPNDVAVVYIDRRADGEAVATRLRLDSDGSFIDPWPHGFFTERLEELLGGLE